MAPSPSTPPSSSPAAEGPAVPRVLSIAGSDSGGGAGIQADLKTIAEWGGYGMTAITAITAQNTQGVQAVHPLPAEVVRAQLDSVASDIAVDAVKVGMLGTAELMRVVADWLEEARPAVVVVDPVMAATSGHALTPVGDAEAHAAWGRLLRAAHLVTPNLPELARLAGRPLDSWAAALDAARELAAAHAVTVLAKGGHLADLTRADPEGAEAGDDPDAEGGVPDALVRPDGSVHEVRGPRVESGATHGTGCTLSAALATLAAGGLGWEDAIERAKPWLAQAMVAGEALAVGDRTRPTWHGPVDHGHARRG
ncbi:bifunctional hydroxymethylpyrimidine kinase/phosphomethylpyrimidine kinase [Micrococcus porci]|uniref:bifunctional hydroxymethylpyrimidine kinase/phosphomethylpyrimidine kinase n=1 Tax=Micrococcus porci TaxID=2856555 RepID=UPI002577C17B|nr:bifunctional hydroxymethylpyrimidine kinase/phosphomethylpyrimidine kinase [Micrococcus porci]